MSCPFSWNPVHRGLLAQRDLEYRAQAGPSGPGGRTVRGAGPCCAPGPLHARAERPPSSLLELETVARRDVVLYPGSLGSRLLIPGSTSVRRVVWHPGSPFQCLTCGRWLVNWECCISGGGVRQSSWVRAQAVETLTDPFHRWELKEQRERGACRMSAGSGWASSRGAVRRPLLTQRGQHWSGWALITN